VGAIGGRLWELGWRIMLEEVGVEEEDDLGWRRGFRCGGRWPAWMRRTAQALSPGRRLVR